VTYDEDDERGANLPAEGITPAVYVIAGLASVGVATIFYGLYSLVSLVF
jgi:hypothetical protein